jgi:hypothetical protein
LSLYKKIILQDIVIELTGENMKINMLTRARCLWNVDYMPREVNRANQLKWVRAIRKLGSNSLLAIKIERKE